MRYGKLWRSELKLHPNLFKTVIICTHTKREHAYEKERKLQRQLNVVHNPLYINLGITNDLRFANREFSKEEQALISEKISKKLLGRKRPDASAFMKENNPMKRLRTNRGSFKIGQPSHNKNKKSPWTSKRMKENNPNSILFECPICHKIGGKVNMIRYHGTNGEKCHV